MDQWKKQSSKELYGLSFPHLGSSSLNPAEIEKIKRLKTDHLTAEKTGDCNTVK